MDDRLTTFGNQLIDSHIRLRELLAALRDGTYTGIDLQTHRLTFCSVLTKHHEAEDTSGFPVLAQHYPELRPVLAELSRDHQQIEEVLDRLKDLSTIDNAQEPVQVRGQPQPWGELSRSKQHARSSAP